MKLLNRWKLLVGLACSSFLLSLGMMPVSTEISDPSVDVRTASLLSSPQRLIATHLNIEELRVGQRVLTGLASDELGETQVDSATWKKLTLTADWKWTDGTLDTFHIQTLQSPEWILATRAQIGSRVPMPLDVQEMGCPDNLLATINLIEPCPQIPHSPGSVIRTTVNHLNPACRTLEMRAEEGTFEKIHTTDSHPFWSNTRNEWTPAHLLAVGEKLRGNAKQSVTLVSSSRMPGTHLVYNLTVENTHAYRVGSLGVLVHNNSSVDLSYLYRTGSRTDATLTDATGVSFRETISSSADAAQVFKPGDKIWALDTSLLPEGSIIRDGAPHGHVSVFADPDDIRNAIVPHGPGNPLDEHFPKPLEESGAYRITR